MKSLQQEDVRPLTYSELHVMALRYADNAQIRALVDQAMIRRLAEVGRKVMP